MSEQPRRLHPGQPRSAGARRTRRVPNPWPKDRPFRILSLDGGGIRGIFSAAVLASLEQRFTGGAPISRYFDLITGTSTGGILALGLGAGFTASELLRLYIERGDEVFPPYPDTWPGRLRKRWAAARQYVFYPYDIEGLEGLLRETLGDRKIGDSANRLLIPSFDGRHSEVYIFKTPHHGDFVTDLHESMVTAALATAAAPTYFRPYRQGGYTYVDGGVWANNPAMLALVEALTTFDLLRENIRLFSIGSGDEPFVVTQRQLNWGGILSWRRIIFAAMRLQSLNAVNQARLLIGPERVIRIDAPVEPKIEMDDWRRASALLPTAAERALEVAAEQVAALFLASETSPYLPLVPFRGDDPPET